MKGFPKYYEVNDTFVKVDYDPKTDEVFGTTASGGTYAPGKCLVDGHEITEKEFNSQQVAE